MRGIPCTEIAVCQKKHDELYFIRYFLAPCTLPPPPIRKNQFIIKLRSSERKGPREEFGATRRIGFCGTHRQTFDEPTEIIYEDS